MAEDQAFAPGLDDESERVELQPELILPGQGAYRIEHGGDKQQHGGEHAGDLPDVAHIDAERCEKPGTTHGGKYQRQQDEGEKQRCPWHLLTENELGKQQHHQADGGVEQCRSEGYPGKNFQREDHFFDVIHVRKNQPGCAVDAFRKQAMHDQADKEDNGETGFAFFPTHAPARLEYDGKHDGVDNKHEQRVEERPCDAHDRAAITPDDFAFNQRENETTIAPEAGDHFPGRYGEALHQANTAAALNARPCASLAPMGVRS